MNYVKITTEQVVAEDDAEELIELMKVATDWVAGLLTVYDSVVASISLDRKACSRPAEPTRRVPVNHIDLKRSTIWPEVITQPLRRRSKCDAPRAWLTSPRSSSQLAGSPMKATWGRLGNPGL
jgi:hypothetical protein